MTRVSWKMPDFAGVALVDILANGVAMLIIVIVVSIAARVERDESYAEQADEVAAVMSHKFSTSLVLNSLAASPPAVLHNYETSPLDQVLDPETLPILELHPGFVREYYSGAIWPRRDLLRTRNTMHGWLAGLTDEQKKRFRLDVYDIAQFYLAMSILREYGIRVRHWHFLIGPLSLADAARCPPGVAAKDCLGSGVGDPPPLPALALDEQHRPGGLGDPDWPVFETGPGDGRGGGGLSTAPGLMPGGVVPGVAGFESEGPGPGGAGAAGGRGGGRGNNLRGSGFGSQSGFGAESAAALGSFPNAREGGAGLFASGSGQPSGDGRGAGGNRVQINLRMALPESIRRAAGAGNEGVPTLDAMFRGMLHFLGELQDTLDAGKTPSLQIANFRERILKILQAPPPITESEQRVARNLALKFALLPLLGDPDSRPDPIAFHPVAPDPDVGAVLVIIPNELNDAAGVGRSPGAQSDAKAQAGGEEEGGGDTQAGKFPERGRVSLALNAYPGIWKGLDLQIEPHSVLLIPPEVRHPGRMRWRAVAYIAPRLDDFIVGFVFSDIGPQGKLRIQGDANRVRLAGQSLFSVYEESSFGARGWLVSLYAALVAGLLLLVLARRFLTERAP